MLDIGWSELVLIGIVALIVVGPKDLPRMFHTLGRFTGKLRGMAREFQSAMNDAARDSGLDEMRRDMSDIVSKKSLGLDALETAATRFEQWDPTKPRAAAAAGAGAMAATAAEAEADADLIDEMSAELADSAAQTAPPVQGKGQGSPRPATTAAPDLGQRQALGVNPGLNPRPAAMPAATPTEPAPNAAPGQGLASAPIPAKD